MSRKASIVQLMKDKNLSNNTDASYIRSVLNEKSVTHTDDSLHNTTQLTNKLGESDVGSALLALEMASSSQSPLPQEKRAFLRNVVITINTTGISFSSAKTRENIDSLVAGGLLSSEVGNRLKAVGIWTTSPADEIGGDVTTEEVQEAVDWFESERNRVSLLNDATSRWNNVNAAISDGTATTIQQVISVFGA